jgi:spore coat protein U-like protein
MVKIEFILATDDVTNNPQAGLYIDDVSVTVP